MSANKEGHMRSESQTVRIITLSITVIASIVIAIIILMLMTMDVEERCRYPAQIDLEATGSDNEWFNLTVTKTCIDVEDPNLLSLSNIGLLVLEDGTTVSFLEDGVEVIWITMSNAKDNGLDSSYNGSVIYVDADDDGFVSKGDSLLVKSSASGGPLGEGRYIGLETEGGHLSVGSYVCCQ